MAGQLAVGIDGTAASRAALEWTVRRAEVDGSSVVILHEAGNTSYAADESDSLVRAELDFVRALSPTTAVTFEIFHGEPVKVLSQQGERFALVVVGTHKTGFLRGRAFGSTSLRLVPAMTVPLAVVPISFAGTRRGVVVGIEDHPGSAAAVRHGAAEARRSSSSLTLIHARSGEESSPIQSALSLVRDEFPEVVARAREVSGVPGEVLINASATAEVLFMGGPAPGSGLGAVGYDVLLNIAGPTIFVPCEREPAAIASA
jgi:nucleotide-binding universal stress UspA family protein